MRQDAVIRSRTSPIDPHTIATLSGSHVNRPFRITRADPTILYHIPRIRWETSRCGYLLRVLTFAPLSRRKTMLATKAMGMLIVTERNTLRTLDGKACDWKPRGEDSADRTSPVWLLLPLFGGTSHDPVYITPIYNMNNCRVLGNELVSTSMRMFCLGGRDVSPEEVRVAENHFCHGWLSLSSTKWRSWAICVC